MQQGCDRSCRSAGGRRRRAGRTPGPLAIADPNTPTLRYPEDPQQLHGPYTCTPKFDRCQDTINDDLIIYAGRPSVAGDIAVVVMNKQGCVLAAVFNIARAAATPVSPPTSVGASCQRALARQS